MKNRFDSIDQVSTERRIFCHSFRIKYPDYISYY
jgi:hypothetical protein